MNSRKYSLLFSSESSESSVVHMLLSLLFFVMAFQEFASLFEVQTIRRSDPIASVSLPTDCRASMSVGRFRCRGSVCRGADRWTFVRSFHQMRAYRYATA